MKRSKQLAISTMFCLVPALLTTTSLFGDDHHVRRVLVISLDGAHSLDLALWVKNNPNSALAQLSKRGIDFTNASTTKPSDSIPSTVGIFTGASPALGGMYYDDAYNRAWFPPGSNCTGAAGTVIDLKQGYNLGLDGLSGLDPKKLPQRIVNGVCVPVFPHDMIRVNTVFEVVRARGRTAYSEKRPSYDFLNGPSGTGVQDLYTPEIACFPFTPSATVPCNNALLKLSDTEAFDELRVKSVLNEIDGKDHTGATFVGTPMLFGMNFQSVNAAKKDSLLPIVGGYADDLGTPNLDLAGALAYIDDAIRRMVKELDAQNLTDTTAIIIMAKHGETSLDPSKRFVESTSAIQTQLNLAFSPASPPAIVKLTEKSTAFIWLKDQSKTLSVVNVLTKKTVETTLNIAQTLSGESLKLLFPDPLFDPAPPDIVVVPNPGTTYEPPTNPATIPVLAEHGGFNENDTHVPLLVVVPTLPPSVNRSAVTTTQIAPSILNLLGIDTRELQAVQIEAVRVLPGIPLTVADDNSQAGDHGQGGNN
jgi:arylsulfatase A-like enzyme